jgi:hypothetical protein
MCLVINTDTSYGIYIYSESELEPESKNDSNESILAFVLLIHVLETTPAF